MKRFLLFTSVCFLALCCMFAILFIELQTVSASFDHNGTYNYWFILHRKANLEILYRGITGDIGNSIPVRFFRVKTGIPGERPTPLPQRVGREYWLITAKEATDNPETAPYFLTLNVPGTDKAPFGPVPYTECNGQCNWVVPGAFGLHGVDGDESRLSAQNPGSSGCIRHSNADITYIYDLLEPSVANIRYYIQEI